MTGQPTMGYSGQARPPWTLFRYKKTRGASVNDMRDVTTVAAYTGILLGLHTGLLCRQGYTEKNNKYINDTHIKSDQIESFPDQ